MKLKQQQQKRIIIILGVIILYLKECCSQSLPINNLERSLKASASSGTIIALNTSILNQKHKKKNSSSKDEAILILMRQPKHDAELIIMGERTKDSYAHNDDVHENNNNNNNTNNATTTIIQEKNHHPILLKIERLQTLQVGHINNNNNNNSSGGAAVLTPSIITCMTGFAPDVSHLIKYTANCVGDLYESEYNSSSSNNNMFLRSIVRNVGEKVSSKTFAIGSQPYAVSCLFAGTDLRVGRNNNVNGRNGGGGGEIYEVDPSGGWHSRRFGVVLGKYSQAVVKQLTERLFNDDKEVNNTNDDSFNNNEYYNSSSSSSLINQCLSYLLDLSISSCLHVLVEDHGGAQIDRKLFAKELIALILYDSKCYQVPNELLERFLSFQQEGKC